MHQRISSGRRSLKAEGPFRSPSFGRLGHAKAKAKKSSVDWKAVGRRVREMRGFETSQSDFARQLGVTQGQLSKYEKGISEIGAEVLLHLARKSGKSIEWWLTGESSSVDPRIHQIVQS